MKKILLTTILGLISISGFSQGSSKKGSWSTVNMTLCKEEMKQKMQDLKVNSLDKFVVCFCKELEKLHDSYRLALYSLEDPSVAGEIGLPCVNEDQSYLGSNSECLSGDCINGYAEMIFANGDGYAGNLKDGLPNGKGWYIYANGTEYEGTFKEGKKHGKGVFRVDGIEGSGTWKDDKKNGKFILRVDGEIIKRLTFLDDKIVD